MFSFKTRKLIPTLMEDIWGTGLGDVRKISKFNKDVRFW